MSDKRCDECKYAVKYHINDLSSPESESRLRCHRFPPGTKPMNEFRSVSGGHTVCSQFPAVLPGDWCWEYQCKDEVNVSEDNQKIKYWGGDPQATRGSVGRQDLTTYNKDGKKE